MADLRLVVNYSAPSAGFTRACPIQTTFTAVPFNIDFKALEGSNLADTPFRPTGVYIDNTQSANPLVIVINELNYRIACPAGASLNLPYPAPAYSTASITGNGPASIIFVDYPVQPYSSATGGTQVATAWGTITGTLSAQTDLQTALNAKITNPMAAVGDLIMGTTAGAPVALSIGSTGQVLEVAGGVATWATLSKSDVGLGNVDNTSDVNKPVSTAQAAAIAAGTAFAFSAYKVAALQAIPNGGVITKLTFDTLNFNMGSGFSTATSIFTVPAGGAGKYVFGGVLVWNSPAGADAMSMRLFKNGAQVANLGFCFTGIATDPSFAGSTALMAAVGDTFELYAVGAYTAGTRNVYGAAGTTQFYGYKIAT